MILPGDASESIAAAARQISAGGLLGLPTETVYGLAADADNDVAVAQIFAAKGRPSGHPLIVHVANAAAVDHFAVDVPAFARQLMESFWPGPLTLILPRRPGVASAAAGGHATIGLRCPAHPLALALLNWGQIPINFKNKPPTHGEFAPHFWGLAAPSANLFGRVSPTTAQHVHDEFGAALLILDGGPCQVGIESTIIDCTRGQPVLLRPGAITPQQLQAVCGLQVLQKEELQTLAAPAPKASGTLDSHYAPKARVRLMDALTLRDALRRIDTPDAVTPLAVWHRTDLPTSASGGVLLQAMPALASAAAQQLFATLREFDALGVQQIWIESPPAETAWDGVRDRLQRAAH